MSESKCGKCDLKNVTGCLSPIHHKKFHYVVRDLGPINFTRTTDANVIEAVDKATLENGYSISAEKECAHPLKSRLVFIVDVNSKHMALIAQIYQKMGAHLLEMMLRFLVQDEEKLLEAEGVDSAILWRDVPDAHPASLVIGLITDIMGKHGHPVSDMGKLGDVQLEENLARARALFTDNMEVTGHQALIDMQTGQTLMTEAPEEDVEEVIKTDPVKKDDDDSGGTVH